MEAELQDVERDEARYREFLFARGYLLGSGSVSPPKPDWRKVALGSLTLVYDPVQPFGMAQVHAETLGLSAATSWVAILRRVLDTQDWASDNHEIATHAAHSLARSEKALLDRIDHWNGRFLLIYGSHGKTRIMTDACALRSAYYSFKGGLTVASHAGIVAERVGAGLCPKMQECAKDQRWRGSVGKFPGNVTPFADVYVLTPNTLIEVEERRISRFFPRTPLEQLSAKQAADISAPLLRRTALEWANTYSLAVSLTAGIDSRVTLSALKDAQNRIDLFTYVHNDATETDYAVAADIASASGLKHRRFDLADGKSPVWEAFRQAYGRNSYTLHKRAAAWSYYNAFAPSTVHLRSNLGEIARAFYRKSGRVPQERCTPKTMADVFKPEPMSDNPFVLESFERFSAVTEFDQIANYDPWDMLYWEQRMSSWHSSLVIGTDLAFDTLILFNNRSVLSPLLATSVTGRLKSRAFRHIVRRLWPELLRWKIKVKDVRRDVG